MQGTLSVESELGKGSTFTATALRNDAIPARCCIFFTATPRYLNGKTQGAGEEADLEVASMDDDAVFGPEIHRLSFGEAIRRNLLSDYRVVVVGVSDTEAHRLAEEGARVAFEGKNTDARSLARQIGLPQRQDSCRVNVHGNRGARWRMKNAAEQVFGGVPRTVLA
jgi:predicted helicase